jgi:hypothetical protein
LCVAVSNTGDAVTSSDPAAGISSWNDALIAGPPCELAHTGCVSEQLYAYDDSGTRPVDSTPPDSGSAIANVGIVGTLLSWTHNGTPQTMTLN